MRTEKKVETSDTLTLVCLLCNHILSGLFTKHKFFIDFFQLFLFYFCFSKMRKICQSHKNEIKEEKKLYAVLFVCLTQYACMYVSLNRV